jgi:hypothetical protein
MAGAPISRAADTKSVSSIFPPRMQDGYATNAMRDRTPGLRQKRKLKFGHEM